MRCWQEWDHCVYIMWDCRGADIAGEGKPFQGQHGNITFERHITAMSCVEAVQEPKMG